MPKKITDGGPTIVEFRESGGNVFADMALDNPEALSVKAGLAREVNHVLDERGLTQAQAARLLQIHQPQVSLLRRGRLSDFSIERLLRFLALLGVDVEVRLNRRPPSETRSISRKKKTEKASLQREAPSRRKKTPSLPITMSASR
ncbi:MAG TPA: helix-turn-helix transcriptional regulator [Bryobacteraceae bacterium]|nr:helix-turn-helix transcriptional regulator [Bryobacteraceae bacterium]